MIRKINNSHHLKAIYKQTTIVLPYSSYYLMNKFLLFTIFIACYVPVFSQEVEDVFFHLYTDSLKKGTHNYINIDGKLKNGKWQPLTAQEILFSSNYGKFEGNDLVLPDNPTVKKVNVKAVLKKTPSISKQITIWIKQLPDPPLLKNDIDSQSYL